MNTSSPASNQGKKLLEQVRDTLRTKHYSYRTEKSYLDWIKRFILFHKKRHPRDMGSQEVQDYITYLAVERKVSASSQRFALPALGRAAERRSTGKMLRRRKRLGIAPESPASGARFVRRLFDITCD